MVATTLYAYVLHWIKARYYSISGPCLWIHNIPPLYLILLPGESIPFESGIQVEILLIE